jgi:hypothetical protein
VTTFSASLTNLTVLLPQSRDSSHHVSEAKCPPRPIHLPLLRMQTAHHLNLPSRRQSRCCLKVRDLNTNIAADSRGSFRFKWPLILNTSNKKYTLKDVSIYLLPKFKILLEIEGGGSTNTHFSKWSVQYDILTIISFQTNKRLYLYKPFRYLF